VTGPIGLDRLDVLLACVEQPADQADDQSDVANREQPAAEDQAQEQEGGPQRTHDRPERRAGHVHAGRRTGVDPGRQDRGRRFDVVVVDPQALGQPVEQGQDQGDDT
jgi:hypothetical protein